MLFSSVVRKMSWCNSQKRGTARISQIILNFWILMDVSNFLIVMYVPLSVFCVLMPPGVNLIAVKYISYRIIYIISYQTISYHVIPHHIYLTYTLPPDDEPQMGPKHVEMR
jgi:hypothetical protein